MSTKAKQDESTTKGHLDDELVHLSSACRKEIYEIAGVTSDGVYDVVPDPASLAASARRILVRSIFAYIEALTFAIKTSAIDHSEILHTAEELSFVKEEAYELNDRGLIRKTKAKLRLLSNLRFAFNLYAKLQGFEYVLNCGGTGWQQLTSSVKVRDRLTHPKSVADLFVTDDEIQTALSAFFWFDEEIISLMKSHGGALRKRVKNLQDKLEACKDEGGEANRRIPVHKIPTPNGGSN
jgi:hypothetical protein